MFENKLIVEQTKIDGLVVIEPIVHQDERGSFVEIYDRDLYTQYGIPRWDWRKENVSRSVQGVLRGLHYHKGRCEAKLFRVTVGRVFDAIVDMRFESKTFKEWVGIWLTDYSCRQILIPPGCAHGFYVYSTIAEVQYKSSWNYEPEKQCILKWDDTEVGINWPFEGRPLLSKNDKNGKSFKELINYSEEP